ncbi:hypothetical protein IKE79_01330 [Candidatus Saccharibacteria bacterium]|nr:hypothetical protein [Candidatus Saccharibacteria bacterium]
MSEADKQKQNINISGSRRQVRASSVHARRAVVAAGAYSDIDTEVLPVDEGKIKSIREKKAQVKVVESKQSAEPSLKAESEVVQVKTNKKSEESKPEEITVKLNSKKRIPEQQAQQPEEITVKIAKEKAQPKAEVETIKVNYPKITHHSRLITAKPGLPKAPEPIMIDRVRQVALEGTGRAKRDSREALEQDIREIQQIQAASVRKVRAEYTKAERQRTAARVYNQARQASAPAPVYQPVTGKQMKETAIEKALASAKHESKKSKRKKPERLKFGAKRVVLALACAGVAAFGIVYLIDTNSSTAQMKVAAMQTGIEASYPSYVPRGFDLSDITSENGKITMNFRNAETGDAFTLIEEQLTGNGDDALEKYIKSNYGKDYTVVQEAGAPVHYVSGSDATWISNGIIYKLKMISGSFTKKQIKTIVASV